MNTDTPILINVKDPDPTSGASLGRTPDQRLPRVLLIAEACNPEWASVPLVGFNFYTALSRVAEVTLVTQVRNRPALERTGATLDRIAFIDSERLAAPFYRLGQILTLGKGLGWTTKQAVMWVPYLYFESLVYERFRSRLRRGEFDLVHRVTPLSPTYPSPLASWTEVPFVLGPLNGGLPWPPGAARTRLAEMEWLGYLRDLYRLLPYCRQTYARAACIIAGSRYTLSSLPRRARCRAFYMPENGIDPSRFHAQGRSAPSRIEPFRILFVGRLVPYKGVDVLLEAVGHSAMLRDNVEVVIVGDGPERPRLQQLVRTLALTRRVSFAGTLPQEQVAEFYRSSSVFGFPSLREFGGAVVIEAMACGLPSIVLNYGGPGEHVTPETGRAIPVASRPVMLANLRNELLTLYSDRQILDSFSRKGLERIRTLYTWEAKARRIHEVYRGLLG